MGIGDGLASVVTGVGGWIKQPLTDSTEMSALDWLLFTGLIIVAIILWTMVLKEIGE